MLLIKNGTVIDPSCNRNEQADLLIQDGKIAKIAPCGTIKETDCESIDATGKIVAPGLVDVHVHFRDPGFTYKEDIETGAQAALRGGFTSVVLMANTKPVVDNEETLRYVLDKGAETPIHVYSCASVTKGLAGKEIVDMDALRRQGAAGFTDDGIPLLDADLLEQAFIKAAKLGVPVSLHEENPSRITNNGINSDIAQKHFGIGGSPREAEIDMIGRDVELALKTGVILDIQHISTKEGVELVRKARKQSSKIHAEATPHHFSLTQEALIAHGTMAKMNPPLRLEEDRQAIIRGIQDGTIDIIATDHAPHSAEEKAKPLTEAPSGIIGLETALALGITHLVETGKISFLQLIACMSWNPAQMYGLNAGNLAINRQADVVIIDPKKQWTVEKFASKSANSPFIGETLTGAVEYTIVGGRVHRIR